MKNSPPDDPTNRFCVGGMFVCRIPQGSPIGGSEQLPQEPACDILVPVFAEHRLKQVSVPIDCPVQVSPPSVHSDVGLVQVPGNASVISSLVFELLDHQWSEPELPDTDCLVADFEATLEEKFRDVSETELVPKSSQYRHQDDVGRELEIVEERASSFIELRPARPTEEGAIAEGCQTVSPVGA